MPIHVNGNFGKSQHSFVYEFPHKERKQIFNGQRLSSLYVIYNFSPIYTFPCKFVLR